MNNYENAASSEQRASQGKEVFSRLGISFFVLLGGRLPNIDLSYYEFRRPDPSVALEYARLGELPFHCHMIEHDDGSREFVLIGPSLNGRELNHLMYFAAPNRNTYGLDTDDITGDWTNLYSGQDDNPARLERHRRIPGWINYEAEKNSILDLIKKVPRAQQLRPLIRIKQTPDGQREWVFSSNDLPQEMIRALGSDCGLSPLAGLVFLQAYSSEITNQLPRNMGHNPAKNFQMGGFSDDDRNQTMGSTQDLPLLTFSVHPKFKEHFPDLKNVFDSKLLAQIEAYLKTGRIPELADSDIQPTSGGLQSTLVLSNPGEEPIVLPPATFSTPKNPEKQKDTGKFADQKNPKKWIKKEFPKKKKSDTFSLFFNLSTGSDAKAASANEGTQTFPAMPDISTGTLFDPDQYAANLDKILEVQKKGQKSAYWELYLVWKMLEQDIKDQAKPVLPHALVGFLIEKLSKKIDKT